MALAGVQVVTSPSNGCLLNPKDVGSGFLLHHKGEVFFVTVRHVVNKEKNNIDGELSEDTNKMAIITNGYRFNEKTGLKEGELYSIGGFYTFDLFNVLDEEPEADRVEIAFYISKYICPHPSNIVHLNNINPLPSYILLQGTLPSSVFHLPSSFLHHLN